MFKRLLGTALVMGVAGAAPPAYAKTCGMRDDLVAQLQEKFLEELKMGGLQRTTSGETVMEIWASEQHGTYTVLITQANGVSCVVAAGTDLFYGSGDASLGTPS